MMLATASALDVTQVRSLFPALNQEVYGKPLVYFDNAATFHRPLTVINRARRVYEKDNANMHRGMHALATRTTAALEEARLAVQTWLHAAAVEEIVFTPGTTAGLNLIAATYGPMAVGAGDEVLVSEMEHHSNLIPWQLLCKKQNATLKVIPIDGSGQLDLTHLDRFITVRTKIVAISYVSNTLGTINPISTIIAEAHAKGAVVVVDGAQAVAHLPLDVALLDCDFFVCSAHKAYGLMGMGILYGKKKWLEVMPPYQVGGGMVQQVTLTEAVYQPSPYKFEAGTLPLAPIVSFVQAIQFMLGIGYAKLAAHEAALTSRVLYGLSCIPGINLVGTAVERVGIVAFNVAHMHHLDVGLLLDARGVAVRTGHCCTQPLMHRLGIEGIVRVSFAVYNTLEEVDFFLEALAHIVQKGT